MARVTRRAFLTPYSRPARTSLPGSAPVCSPFSNTVSPATSVARYPSTPYTRRRPPAGRSFTRCGACNCSPEWSIRLMSARSPGRRRPRSVNPKKSAVSEVCALTTDSAGGLDRGTGRAPSASANGLACWHQRPIRNERRRRPVERFPDRGASRESMQDRST